MEQAKKTRQLIVRIAVCAAIGVAVAIADQLLLEYAYDYDWVNAIMIVPDPSRILGAALIDINPTSRQFLVTRGVIILLNGVFYGILAIAFELMATLLGFRRGAAKQPTP